MSFLAARFNCMNILGLGLGLGLSLDSPTHPLSFVGIRNLEILDCPLICLFVCLITWAFIDCLDLEVE